MGAFSGEEKVVAQLCNAEKLYTIIGRKKQSTHGEAAVTCAHLLFFAAASRVAAAAAKPS